jgi:hypothetical protein
MRQRMVPVSDTRRGVLGAFREFAGVGPRVRVRAKLAFALGRDAIALSERLEDFAKLGRERVTDIGFCISVRNDGGFPVNVVEVGLIGRFSSPRIALHEPLLHDNKPWPRRLAPGEEVVAHFGTRLKALPVLRDIRRVYAQTRQDEMCYGAGPALRYYIGHALKASAAA